MKLTAGLRRAWQHVAPATKKDVERILMKLSDLAGAMGALTTTVDGIKTEVDALKVSLANVELPADAQTALDNLSGHIKAVQDDLVPPASPTPTGG